MKDQIELALNNTRKSVLEVCTELMVECPLDIEIGLKQCNCCGLWLKKMQKDLDGLDICSYCLDAYGP